MGMTIDEARTALGKERKYALHENKQAFDIAIDTMRKYQQMQGVLDKIRAEITNCLKALDEIEKSGFNIYPPNEMSSRRLTYQQCLGFIDKYKAEIED